MNSHKIKHYRFLNSTVISLLAVLITDTFFIGCLHDPENVQLYYNIWQQTSSITFAGSLLDVCWIA